MAIELYESFVTEQHLLNTAFYSGTPYSGAYTSDNLGVTRSIPAFSYNSGISYRVPDGATKVVHYFLKLDTLFQVGPTLLYQWFNNDDPSNQLGGIGCDHGKIYLQIGASTVFTTATEFIPINRWLHLQIKTVIGDSGMVQVRVDDTLVLDYTGDTKPNTYANINCIRVRGTGTGQEALMLHLIVDSANFLGVVNGKIQVPTNNGYYDDWSKSAVADGYTLIDDTACNTSDYVYSQTAGQKQSVSYPDHNLPSNASIVARVVTPVAKRVSSGQIRFGIRTPEGAGGTDYMGDIKDIPVGFITVPLIMEVNPATGLAWSLAGANNVEDVMEMV